MSYRQDGGVISSKTPTREVSTRDHYQLFGLYRGQVIRVLYPDDKENSNKTRIEYVVRINGQDYPNAVSANMGGAIYNQSERILKDTEKSFTSKLDVGVYPENLDGEFVYVLFLEGHGNVPVIIGCADHPRQDLQFKREDGRFYRDEFNGIEIKIDKDANYSIKQVGLKNEKGEVQNKDGVDSFVKLYKNGDIELNTHGDDTLKVKLTKSSKKMEFKAQGNSVVYDNSGVAIVDKNNNEFKFTSAGMSMKAVDKASIEATGDLSMKGAKADVQATGEASFKGDGGTKVGSGGSATDVNGSAVNLAGGGVPVAKVGSQSIGVGNLGAPVISNIIDGSTKVFTS